MPLRPSAISTSAPNVRNETGEGNELEGAVGGDIPGDEDGNFGEAAEGNDGVEP